MIFSQQTEPDCVQDVGSWCARIYQFTDNAVLARYSDAVIGTSSRLLLILLLAVLVRLVVHRAIKRLERMMAEASAPALPRLNRRNKTENERDLSLLRERRVSRARTIGSVLRSASTLAIFAVAATLMLGELGINVAPILASVGIVGLALGFGAQNLVQDFLSGIFMLLEDQYGVGDVVDFGEAAGVVEAVGMRITTVRDEHGTVWYVRNGQVQRVGNASQGPDFAVVDVPVAHGADITAALRLAEATATELLADPAWAQEVLEAPKVLGVTEIDPIGLTLRITVKVRPGQRWVVERALRAAIQEAFASAEIPPPVVAG